MLIYQLEPKPCVDSSEQRPVFDHTDPDGRVRRGLAKMTEYREQCERVKEEIRGLKGQMEGTKAEKDKVMVTTLGTGAALPSRYRNGGCLLPFAFYFLIHLTAR